MFKVTAVTLGIILGCTVQSNGMDFPENNIVIINIQTEPHKSESPGWFSFLWACFEDNEETVSLIASDDSLSRKTPNPYLTSKHIPLIEFSKINQQAREVLIDRLCNKLIPDNLIQSINFEDLLNLNRDIKASKIPYNSQMIIVTYLPPEHWPRGLGTRIIKKTNDGDINALYLVGYMYLNGKSLPQDSGKAYKAFKESADKGNGNAQNYVGFLYAKGMGVDADPYWSGYYYKKSANQGNPSAQNNLGSLYERGDGVGQDYTLAYKYYRLSADQGNVNAQLNLAHLYESGKILGRAVKDAMACYQSHADEGNARAQVLLGLAYKGGKGIERNIDLAIKYFRLAAAQGNERAQLELADLFQNAPDLEEDIDKAYRYLLVSAVSCERDTSKADLAIGYLISSADRGIAKAQYDLGFVYEKGCSGVVGSSRDEAVRYYTLAANQGHMDALTSLSKLYSRKGMRVRMELAHNANLTQRDFFTKLYLNSPFLSPKDRQEDQKKIEQLILELIDIDKIYVATGAWAEGNMVEHTPTSESYMDLFKLTGNDKLKEMSMSVSKDFEKMTNAIKLLCEVGTCLTCLDGKIEPLMSFQKLSFNYTDYLCFTELERDSLKTDVLQKTLMDMIGFFKNSHNLILTVKKPKKLLEKVDDLKISNLDLWSFLNCYTQHFHKDLKIEAQQKFLMNLGKFFEKNLKRTELHLTYAKEFEAKFSNLVESTTLFRNDLFLKYVGLRDEFPGNLEILVRNEP